MLLDYENAFARNQTMVLAAGTYGFSNTIDLWGGRTALPTVPGIGGSPLSDFGRGGKLRFFAQITQDFLAAAGAATVQVQIITGTGVDGAGVINAGQVILCQSDAIPKASLLAGYRFRVDSVPAGNAQRYLSGRFIIATNPGTQGTIFSALAVDLDDAYGAWL